MTIKVDLLPSEKRGFGLDPVLIVLLIIVVLCVVVFYFISAWLDSDIARKKDEVKQWDDKITLIKADIPKITKIRDDNNRLKTQIEVIKSLSNDPERYANVLYELGTLIPPNVWVTSLAVDTSAYDIQIQCSVTSAGAKPLETIAKFMTDLSTHSRYFKDATLSSTSAVKGQAGQAPGYNFGLDTHYDPVKSTKSWALTKPGGDTGAANPSENPPPASTPETPAGSGSPESSASASESPNGSGSPAAESGSPASSSSTDAGSPAASSSSK